MLRRTTESLPMPQLRIPQLRAEGAPGKCEPFLLLLLATCRRPWLRRKRSALASNLSSVLVCGCTFAPPSAVQKCFSFGRHISSGKKGERSLTMMQFNLRAMDRLNLAMHMRRTTLFSDQVLSCRKGPHRVELDEEGAFLEVCLSLFWLLVVPRPLGLWKTHCRSLRTP